MAQEKPSRSQGSKILNIMDAARGRFDFRTPTPKEEVSPVGVKEFIPPQLKTKLLQDSLESFERDANGRKTSPVTQASMMALMSSSYAKVGRDRLENRRILELMPNVKKAAKLMVASILAPNDLSRNDIKITFDVEGLDTATLTKLGDAATDFFQKKLDLRTSVPKWIYQFGYETGASVFAVIPLTQVQKFQDQEYVGTEDFVKKVVEPACHESVFGFGDGPAYQKDNKSDLSALESFACESFHDLLPNPPKPGMGNSSPVVSKRGEQSEEQKKAAVALTEYFLGTEKLNLTDNPNVLQFTDLSKEKQKNQNKKKLKEKYGQHLQQTMAEISGDAEENKKTNDDPILFRLPAESVTVIHTPGDPSDHQGYLVLLDIAGNPVTALSQEEDDNNVDRNFSRQQSNNLFAQIHQAYGLGTNQQTQANRQAVEAIYQRVVKRHLEKRLNKAGFGHSEIPNVNAVMRCMFTRLLAQKQTRLLFLPKELVTYMTFEYDPYGYGVSKLNAVKFSLGMKMALQISRILAAIKASMDKRKISMNFTDSMMEQPENIYDTAIQQYIQKTAMQFSTDPGYIQHQIAQKSFSVSAKGIPGMEDFEVTNEPDSGSGARDFDPTMMDQLDKDIINGLGVPASAMNSLSEDEYARSVVTTNLFFAMEVAIYQDIVIERVSDLIQKFGLYSGNFQNKLGEIIPELKTAKKSTNSSTDEALVDPKADDKSKITLPKNCTFETLMEGMRIALPKPNVAPSKAQFESMDAMIGSIRTMMENLFSDDLAGNDDKMRPIIALLRNRFTAVNVQHYLENSGMSGIQLPKEDFGDQLTGIINLQNGLSNVMAMLANKQKIDNPEPPADAAAAPGY